VHVGGHEHDVVDVLVRDELQDLPDPTQARSSIA
jgi:hypothetical protein